MVSRVRYAMIISCSKPRVMRLLHLMNVSSYFANLAISMRGENQIRRNCSRPPMVVPCFSFSNFQLKFPVHRTFHILLHRAVESTYAAANHRPNITLLRRPSNHVSFR